ncbi:MAG: DUF853 family protein [Thiotrichales bacterium]|nr:DUF853 family protein [Thiotrichales bacterium]
MRDFDFILGKHANRPELPPLTWNPDSPNSVNPHLLLCGGSGSGKTTLLLSLASYLAERGKHIFILDLKGDMVVRDSTGNIIGNYIEFTAWDSPYGLNPFEFSYGMTEEELTSLIEKGTPSSEEIFKLKNSGPKVQINRIIDIFKEFMPNMGAMQKNVIAMALGDTYRLKGIEYDDYSTWTKELPSLKDTLFLFSRIKEEILCMEPDLIDSDTNKFLTRSRRLLAKKAKLMQQLDEANAAGKKTETIESKIEGCEQDALSLFTEYFNSEFDKFTSRNAEDEPEEDAGEYPPLSTYGINIKDYASKKVLTTLETVEAYLKALESSGVFHDNKPPVKAGLNIINISGLDLEPQKFCVNLFLTRIFNFCKIRGPYHNLPNKHRGQKVDTYVLIDESKLIVSSKDRQVGSLTYLNRIATEARGYGLGICLGSQSAEHFISEALKNFDSQIILNTSAADFDIARKSFGIDKPLLEFTNKGWGKALVKCGREFVKINLAHGANQ